MSVISNADYSYVNGIITENTLAPTLYTDYKIVL